MTFEELYEELEKLVHYIAHTRANGAFLMDHDEISGELFEEMVKGYARYGHLPNEELIVVVKRMMDNRLADLADKYYKSHRGLGNGSLSISDDYSEDELRDIFSEELVIWTSSEKPQDALDILESRERVQETYNRLSINAKRVLQAILEGNPALELQLCMAGLRASHVYKGVGKVKVRSWQVADSLNLSDVQVKKAYKEIKNAYAEVLDVSV